MSIAVESTWVARNDTAAASLTIPSVVVVAGQACMTVKVAMRSTAASVSGITWGAKALSRQAFIVGTNNRGELWYAVGLTPGTNDIVISYTGGTTKSVAGAVVRTGVDQFSPIGNAFTAAGNSATPSVNVLFTESTDLVIIDALGFQAVASATATPNAGQTQTTGNATTGTPALNNVAGFTSQRLAVANPQGMGWTIATVEWWTMIGSYLRPRQKLASFNVASQATANMGGARPVDMEMRRELNEIKARMRSL